MWICSRGEELGGWEMGDGRTPGSPAGRSGGSARHLGASACTRSGTEMVMPQSCVHLRAPVSAKQPVLAHSHPGPGEKKLFWSSVHALLLTEQRWAVASSSRRGREHRGALTLISFTDIKGLSKAEMMPCLSGLPGPPGTPSWSPKGVLTPILATPGLAMALPVSPGGCAGL